MKKIIIASALLLAVLLFSVGCKGSEAEETGEKDTTAATTTTTAVQEENKNPIEINTPEDEFPNDTENDSENAGASTNTNPPATTTTTASPLENDDIVLPDDVFPED